MVVFLTDSEKFLWKCAWQEQIKTYLLLQFLTLNIFSNRLKYHIYIPGTFKKLQKSIMCAVAFVNDEWNPIELQVTNLLTVWWVLRNFEMCIVASLLFYCLIDSCRTKVKLKKVFTGKKLSWLHYSVLACSRLSVSGGDWKSERATGRGSPTRPLFRSSHGPTDKEPGAGLHNMMKWVLNVNFLVCSLILLSLYSHVVLPWCWLHMESKLQAKFIILLYLLERCMSVFIIVIYLIDDMCESCVW